MRLDRLATLYIAAPLLRFAAQGPSVPILMYHSICDEQDQRSHPYYCTTTSRAVFASQMEWLHRNRFKTCSPSDVLACVSNSDRPTKVVSITFDDGFRDFYREAFPILSRFGFTATVFLPTGYVGESTLQFKGRDCMTWSEIRELQTNGITFGSHTVTHPQLFGLCKEAIERELVDSKLIIEEKLGSRITSFAYPYAFPKGEDDFKQHIRGALARAGYSDGVCTAVGRATASSDPLFMERLPVNGLDDHRLFEAKISGAYDWVASVQTFAKWVKTRETHPRKAHSSRIDVQAEPRI